MGRRDRRWRFSHRVWCPPPPPPWRCVSLLSVHQIDSSFIPSINQLKFLNVFRFAPRVGGMGWVGGGGGGGGKRRIISATSIIDELTGFLMCIFRASCYSTRLSWAHTPVMNSRLLISSNPFRR